MLLKNYIYHPNKKINKLLLKLFTLHPNEIDLSLKRIERLLENVGNPHLNLPKVIHIAGTNGKGSTATIIYELQKKFGKTVHLYRSPHLISFNERIHVSNKEISNSYLEEILKKILIANKSNPITFFEITTAAAFLAFSENFADLVILEVGLGGRFDATNIIRKKEVAIITAIGKDHTEYLGSNLSQITKEKSGIILKDSLLICSKQHQSVKKMVIETAIKQNCKSYIYGRDWHIKNKILFFDDLRINLSKLSLIGDHQLYNAGCAIIACKKTNFFNFNSNKVLNTIADIEWLGRLHKIKGKVAKKYSECDIWIDSAHNELGFRVLKNWVKAKHFLNLSIIVSIGIKKDYKKILLQIIDMKPSFICFIKEVNFNSHNPEILKNETDKLHIRSNIFEDLSSAIDYSCNLKKKYIKNNILVTGSIALLGELLREDLRTN